MRSELILPVLYEMALAIGGETSVYPLLTRTIQRLLYFTSFPAGFVCIDMPDAGPDGMVQTTISAVVGDYELSEYIGKTLPLPHELVYGHSAKEAACPELLTDLPTSIPYQSFLRLPIDARGTIVLLAPVLPESELPVTQMFLPIMSNLSKAIKLCKQQDAHNAAMAAQQSAMQQSLARSEFSLRTLIELSPVGIAFFLQNRITDANKAALTMFGYDSLNEVRDKPIDELIAPAARENMQRHIQGVLNGSLPDELYESIGLRQDGTEFPFLIASRQVELADGAVTFSFFIDITERKQYEQRITSSNELLRSVLETAPIRIFWKDTCLRYLGCNTLFAHDAGMQNPEQLIGKDDEQMTWYEQASLYRADDQRVIETGLPRLNYEEPQTTPDGKQIWLRTSKAPLRNANGEVIGVLGLYDDITQQKAIEEQIRHLAFYDPLTALPNRRLLIDRLKQAGVSSQRSRKWCALVLFDLDNFKIINDTRGHSIGDKLLVEVAARVQGCLRTGDTVARLGGDEFVAVLVDLSTNAGNASVLAERIAEKILYSISTPYTFDQGEFHITPSIGVTLFCGSDVSEELLMVRADSAMYQAKAAGRNCVRFYDPTMQEALEARSQIETGLRSAIARNELELFYQPQFDDSQCMIGLEGLLRWRHPEHGLVSPARFIPVAEETNLILPIGEWIRAHSCAQLARWSAIYDLRRFTLSINVSAREFRQSNFVALVQQAVETSGISPEWLKLELTESLLMENIEDCIRKMTELRKLGIRFSIDDFGTGYSSFSYLKRLPIDQIKIDQSFVRDIATDPNDAAIVKTIVAMANSLDLDVIAEGVETEAQRNFLMGCGCRSFQGYLFSKPMPIHELEQFWDNCSQPNER